MTLEDLKQKALEIAEMLFNSQDLYISRGEFNSHLQGDFAEYGDLIRDALTGIPKITKQQGRTGGIKYSDERYRRSKLTQSDFSTINKKIDHLFKEYNESNSKPKKEKPEKEIEIAFYKWLNKQDDLIKNAVVIGFRSDARKGRKWQNVDGYLIEIEKYKYHILFKPILTTFEIKPTIPNTDGIGQAKNYLKFSHHVYLVFKFDGDSESLKVALSKAGYDSREGVGIYFTRDGINFECLYKSPQGNPSEKDLDENIEILLSENDKETLLSQKFQYIVKEILIPSIE